MTTEEIIVKANELRKRVGSYSRFAGGTGGAQAQVCEFLRNYAGPKNSFLQRAEMVVGANVIASLDGILQSFVEYLEAGLALGTSPERKGQMDVVSDILQQANSLLEDTKQHPAAAAMLTGAALEEFLRTWVETSGISIGNAKPGLDSYCKCLRTAELITTQDVKDITSWAGTRNHAAHGEWEQVSDRSRIRLMLEGVNLFMRQKQT